MEHVENTIKEKNTAGWLGLGIGPESTLQNLLDEMIITQRMFSIYLKLGTSYSHIKFGGFDKQAVDAESPNFHIVTSLDAEKWRFAMEDPSVANV